MKNPPKIAPYRQNFPQLLEEFCRQIGEARARNFHHDQRRHLFMNFLKEAFPHVETVEVELEKKVFGAEIRGYIDALYQTTIFEFKTDFDRERPTALNELKKYFKSRPRPHEYIAVLTDGERFELFQWDRGDVDSISTFILTPENPLAAYYRLDQFLKTETPRTPTSFDIVTMFGPHSAVFRHAAALMHQIYATVEKDSAVVIKFREWNKLIAKVYGSELGYADLFITHTYLVILSRLMVARALFPKEKRDPGAYRGIMDGKYFTQKNLPNLAEPDFFSWALGTPGESSFVGLIAKIEKHLAKYDFSSTNEDILKELYQGLVDPEKRHDLGEYYTPDWLAELTLEKAGYNGGSLLDPSCGSGTFLMCAVRRLRAMGLKKAELVEAVSHDFAGIDVHPLAVLMAKANLLLALGEDARGHKTQVRLPIFMADTLQTEVDDKKGYLSIPAAKGCVFYLPLASIENHADQLDRMIEEMHEFARAIAEDGVAVEAARKGFVKKFPFLENGSNREWFFWKQNIETAAKLIKMKRNSVWAFILKNTYRPTFLRKRRVDYIVGNPPWLSYRYIKDEQYKKRIKELASDLALFGKKSSHLITQLDLSTIFYRHCEATFLAEGGKMGFVLPRSVIIGAKQHEGFQKQNQFSLVIDCERVENLFNVPTCVLFRLGGTCGGDQIPSLVLEGRVTPRNAALEIAKQLLHMSEGEHTLVSHEAKSPWYRKMAFQGATIVPRSLYFVERDEDCADVKDAPYLQSSQEAIREAKYQWRHKSVQVSGQVESDYLYYTILAKDLLPFCVRSADPIFLPIKANRQGRLEFYNTNRMIESGQTKAMKWLAYVERTWNHFRKSEQYDACGRLNYNGLLLCQDPKAKYAVIYNGSGTNLTSAVHSYGHFKTLDGIPVQGFIADAKTYYLYLNSEQHADYLCAALNAEPVMEAIKETMPRGLMGERDIHRRPFEACHIPQFDPSVGLHQQIAALGMVCRKKAEKVAEKMEGPIGRARLEMRAYLEDELKQLDPLVAELIQYKGAAKPKPKKRSSKPGELMLLF